MSALRMLGLRLANRWQGWKPTYKATTNVVLAILSALGIGKATDLHSYVAEKLKRGTDLEVVVAPGVSLSRNRLGNTTTLKLSSCGSRPCEVDIVATPSTLVAGVIAFGAVGLLGAGVFGVALQLLLGRSATLRGRRLSVRIETDVHEGVERCRVIYHYEGVFTSAEKFVMPVMRDYYLPTMDGVDVLITELRVSGARRTEGAPLAATLAPVFMPTKHYQGEVLLPGVRPGERVDFLVDQVTVGNFCRDKATLAARWGPVDDTDFLTWTSSAAWDEVVLTMSWKDFQFEGSPTVTHRRGEAEVETEVADRAVFNPDAWTLRLNHVEPGEMWKIRWTLR